MQTNSNQPQKHTTTEIGQIIDILIEDLMSSVIEPLQSETLSISDDFRHISGQVGNTTISLSSMRWSGPSFESITFAKLFNDETTLGIMLNAIPRAETGFPILGLDIFARGPSIPLLALDFSPTNAEFYAENCKEPLLDFAAKNEPYCTRRKKPEFMRQVFSEEAFSAAIHPGYEKLVLTSVANLFKVTLDLLSTNLETSEDNQRTESTRSAINQWKKMMHANQKEFDGFSRLFGADWARRYLVEFLFPL